VRLFSPLKLVRTVANLSAVATGGGPKSVELVRVGEPEGWILPSSELVVDVEARNGTRVRIEPELPMPFAVGWGIRLARRLGVPVISTLEPENLNFRVGSASN
jgi:hypothetical protein